MFMDYKYFKQNIDIQIYPNILKYREVDIFRNALWESDLLWLVDLFSGLWVM